MLLDSGDREGALLMFLCEVVGVPEHKIAVLRKEPAWPVRLAVAHTIPREFSNEDYVLDPSRFRSLKVPTMLLQGAGSPDFIRAATEAVHAALPNSRIVVPFPVKLASILRALHLCGY
jgi:pimeloyl-ACP methyl ester carboxylesterase